MNRDSHRTARLPSDPADPLQRDALFDLRHQGHCLKGSAFGDHGELVLIRIRLDRTGPEASHCTCPSRHDCAHAIAMRRQWERSPESFTKTEDLASALRRTTIDVQVELLDEILRLHPELDAIVDARLGIDTPDTSAPGEAHYRSQVDALFEQVRTASMREEPEALRRLTAGLESIIGHADAALRRSNVLHAATIYVAVAKGVEEHCVEITSDEHYSIHEEGRRAALALGPCLEAAMGEKPVRRTILRMLVDVAPMDPEASLFRDQTMIREVVTRLATPEEAGLVVSWILEKLRNEKGERRIDRVYSNLLVDLGADALDDATFAQACHHTGRLAELVSRLLRSGRIDEAIAEARASNDRTFPALATEFVRAGHAETAKSLAVERLREREVIEHLDWLEAQHESEGRHAEALDVARRAFLAVSTIEIYRKLMGLAAKLGIAEAVKRELCAELASRNRFQVIAELELGDGNLDAAIEMIERSRGHGYHRTIALDVARAAEAQRPEAALRLYAWEVAYLVEVGAKRSRYREACEILARMREIHLAMGDAAGWSERIAAIRSSHGAKRALLAEIVERGL